MQKNPRVSSTIQHSPSESTTPKFFFVNSKQTGSLRGMWSQRFSLFYLFKRFSGCNLQITQIYLTIRWVENSVVWPEQLLETMGDHRGTIGMDTFELSPESTPQSHKIQPLIWGKQKVMLMEEIWPPSSYSIKAYKLLGLNWQYLYQLLRTGFRNHPRMRP